MILGSRHIDHANLKPFADINKLCEEALTYKFRGICVHPCNVSIAAGILVNTDIKIVTVVGFPLGANTTESKIFEAKEAIGNGADEIDVVWDIGAFKAAEYLRTTVQLASIVEAAKDSHDCMVKVIVEICYLSQDEVKKAYQVVSDSGADYIKTSTGFGPKVWNSLSISTWNRLKGNLKIKASGGIDNYNVAQYFLNLGADIIGTSHGVKIMEEKDAYSKL